MNIIVNLPKKKWSFPLEAKTISSPYQMVRTENREINIVHGLVNQKGPSQWVVLDPRKSNHLFHNQSPVVPAKLTTYHSLKPPHIPNTIQAKGLATYSTTISNGSFSSIFYPHLHKFWKQRQFSHQKYRCDFN